VRYTKVTTTHNWKRNFLFSCKRSSTHIEKWVAAVYRTRRLNRRWRKTGPLGTTLPHKNVVHISMKCAFKIYFNIIPTYAWAVGRDSSVGIATRYGLDGPEIEYRRRRDFPHPSRPAWSPPSFLYNGNWVFPGGKVVGVWRWPPTPPI